MSKKVSIDQLSNTMSVGDLKEMLEGFDDEALVLITANYGDYHRTVQALPIESCEQYDSNHLVNSAYSASDVAFVEEIDEEWMCDTDGCANQGKVLTVGKCPKCGEGCYNEDGEQFIVDEDDDDDMDTFDVVILST